MTIISVVLTNDQGEDVLLNKKQVRLNLLEQQIRRLERRIGMLEPRSNRYSWLRVGIFFLGLALSLFLLIAVSWWLALPMALLTLIAFGIVAYYHDQLDRQIALYTLWRQIKANQVACLKLDWKHIDHPYFQPASNDHPFKHDLDISGKQSIHRLLNTAVSREGGRRLWNWLLNTKPDLAEIQQRQALVQELTPLTRFRDKLILKSLLVSPRTAKEVEYQQLPNQLDLQSSPEQERQLRRFLWIAADLNILTLLFLLSNIFLKMPHFWLYCLLASLIFFMMTSRPRKILESARSFHATFATLKSVFSYLESYPYGNHQLLKNFCAPYHEKYRPSQILQRVERIANAAMLRKNPFLWLPINILLPWDFYWAYRLLDCKKQLAQCLPIWLETWFDLEALCSLASFAYLNPDYQMPQVESGDQRRNELRGRDESGPYGIHAINCAEEDSSFLQPKIDEAMDSSLKMINQVPLFCGKGLGHPLIADDKKVTNDFTISNLGEVIVITGSNMAGKSTFLRTLGVNLCLAYAGSVVNAEMLQISLFRLFTCIRVTDSVTDGYSYFYAEVKRLRALLDALAEPDALPVFFLIDEIFKGTNNRERLIGSRSFIRAVIGKNCVGAISTHDLELAKLAEVRNEHFREEVVDGQLVFDYLLRPGPCPTTNALKIMEMEGLPVEDANAPSS